MRKGDFIKKLKEDLEIEEEEICEETNLKELKEYNSLTALSIIKFVNENYGKYLTASQLASVTTVKSLMEIIGLNHFM